MIKINKLFLTLFVLLFVGACSSDVDFGEQYRKIVYIVKSENTVYVREHKIVSEEQAGGISLYCGGSDELKEDVKVTVTLTDIDVIKRYNAKNFTAWNDNLHDALEMLPAEYYSIDSYSATIKAGAEYAEIPIMIATEDIDPDKNYVIPLAISDASGYEVQEGLDTVLYQVSLINDYSSDYTSIIQNVVGVDDTIVLAKNKYFKAMAENAVRTSVYTLNDETIDYNNLKNNLMTLTIANDNTVTIVGWKSANVTDLGGSKYDPVKHIMYLHYKYEDADGDVLEIIETLTNLEFVEEYE